MFLGIKRIFNNISRILYRPKAAAIIYLVVKSLLRSSELPISNAEALGLLLLQPGFAIHSCCHEERKVALRLLFTFHLSPSPPKLGRIVLSLWHFPSPSFMNYSRNARELACGFVSPPKRTGSSDFPQIAGAIRDCPY